jgi:hypothetical protein
MLVDKFILSQFLIPSPLATKYNSSVINDDEQQRRTTTTNNNDEQQRRTTTTNNNDELYCAVSTSILVLDYLHAEEEWGSSRNATRESVRLIIIQAIYSQRAVRLKTVEIYCDFCCEHVVFSKVCFDNLFV